MAIIIPTKVESEVKFGDQIWYNQDGKIHRDGAPAVIGEDGTEKWFQNGVRHREDGPAITFGDGRHGAHGWWLNDVRYTFKHWILELTKINESHAEDMRFIYANYQ